MGLEVNEGLPDGVLERVFERMYRGEVRDRSVAAFLLDDLLMQDGLLT